MDGAEKIAITGFIIILVLFVLAFIGFNQFYDKCRSEANGRKYEIVQTNSGSKCFIEGKLVN